MLERERERETLYLQMSIKSLMRTPLLIRIHILCMLIVMDIYLKQGHFLGFLVDSNCVQCTPILSSMVIICDCIPLCVQLLCKVKDMARCFQKMAQFLQVAADSNKSDVSIKMGLAVDSLEGLWFICNTDFITKTVSLTIDV